jgi:hypothetical protein
MSYWRGATKEVLARLNASSVSSDQRCGQTPGFFLATHVVGDWGEVNGEAWKANDKALVGGTGPFVGLSDNSQCPHLDRHGGGGR